MRHVCQDCGVELKELVREKGSDDGCTILECPSCLTQHETDVVVFDDAMLVRGVRRDLGNGMESVVEVLLVRPAF